MDQFNFDTYPNTDFNKVNLDWMLEQFPELEARIRALETGGGGAAGDSVFRAVYGTTSFTDIQTALSNNLLPYLEESGDYYTLLMVRPYNISFFRMSGALVWVAICNDVSGWSKYQAEYVTTQSPHFSGVPTAPTAPAGTNSTQLATTAFVKNAIDAIPQGGGGEGLSTAVKQALLACFRNVAWANDNGSAYYAALESALIGTVTLTSISATFVQGDTVVYPSTPLSQLRQYLTVTANYSDGTSAPVVDYTLSGTLETGTSTVTVSYENEEDTFDVTVTAEDVDTRTLLYNWDLTQSIVDTVAGASLTLGSTTTQTGTGITLNSGCQVYVIRTRTGESASASLILNRDYEFDISAMTHDYTGHGRLITYGPTLNANTQHSVGFMYRSTGSWQFYMGSWSGDTTETSPTAFAGKTLRISVDGSANIKAYVDDVLIASSTIPNAQNYNYLYVGDTSNTAYVTTLTGIRIYSTEEA